MPTSRDMKNRSAVTVGRAAASISSDTTTNVTGIDVSGKAAVVIDLFTGAYTDGTYTPNVQESDDNSTFTDVPSTHVVGAETALGAANTVVSIGVQTAKKYVRVQIVSASTSSGAVVGVNYRTYTS